MVSFPGAFAVDAGVEDVALVFSVAVSSSGVAVVNLDAVLAIVAGVALSTVGSNVAFERNALFVDALVLLGAWGVGVAIAEVAR